MNPIRFGSLKVSTKRMFWLVFLAVVLVPFNNLPYLFFIVREISLEGPFYPLSLGMLLLGYSIFTRGSKIDVPRQLSALLLLAFLMWAIISGIVNAGNIATALFKGRTGFEKFFFQITMLIYVVLATYLLYKISVPNPKLLKNVCQAAVISGILVLIYTAIEIPAIKGVAPAQSVLNFLSKLVQRKFEFAPGISSYVYPRVRAMSGEASWLGMALSFLLPWLLAATFTVKTKYRWLLGFLFAYMLGVVYLTASRTALVVAAMEVPIFLAIMLINSRNRKNLIVLLSLVCFIALGIVFVVINPTKATLEGGEKDIDLIKIFQSLDTKDRSTISNKDRYSAQQAGYNIGEAFPIFGVGLGQYGFYYGKQVYLPTWSQGQEFNRGAWINDSRAPWPPVHSIFPRLAAEMGYVGLTIWLSMWLAALVSTYFAFVRNSRRMGITDYYAIALIVAMIGSLISGFNLDSFRFFGYWLCLGLSWAYVQQSYKTGHFEPHSRLVDRVA